MSKFAQNLKQTYMVKTLLAYSFVTLLMLFAPSPAMASEPEMEAPDNTERIDPRGVSISVKGSTVNVEGAAGNTLEIVSITGKHVASVKIESASQRVELNLPKGCYILKADKVVRKVTIR